MYIVYSVCLYLSVFFLSQAVFAKEKEEQRAKVRYTMNLPKCEGAARALIQWDSLLLGGWFYIDINVIMSK
jgi:hypothetical protein